jgi:hypothetical protein
MKRNPLMNWLVVLAVVGIAGCSTQARWVNCDQRLVPINVPAPKASVNPTSEAP